MTIVRKTFPNFEAELRRAGYTYQDVADVLGIHVSGVYLMMQGKRNLTVIRAKILRDALFPDMTLEYLYDTELGKSA